MNHPHRIRLRPTAAAIAIAALFAAPTLSAQDKDQAESKQDKALQAVEVVGTSPLPGIGIEKDKLPYDVQTVTEEQLYRGQSLNLTEYMSRNLLGVNINEVQGSPFQADINYRGFKLSGILGAAQGMSVYLDGVRVNEPFGDVVNWDMIPEAAIGNVTLVPGSNPVYGLNTLGGALAFTTKSGLTAPGGEVKLQAGQLRPRARGCQLRQPRRRRLSQLRRRDGLPRGWLARLLGGQPRQCVREDRPPAERQQLGSVAAVRSQQPAGQRPAA